MGIWSIFCLHVQKGETLVHHAPGYREYQYKKESFTQTKADSMYTLLKEEYIRFHTWQDSWSLYVKYYESQGGFFCLFCF